ncbi:aromatic-ring-hydroxylating dioxygenase subunit beta [Burkholderia multivorans]|uniref:aromatic-ring-hydroxylating dioxygenase subunit beta n=1 Tax=Burkholderia multivorans TaxID=87883 RepID=UPI000CFF9D3D|nr:aromatic-ring-hydroxylating dioxygenase subunit beta [Burkholderia multivorans]PRF64449.1 aromatic-ring-hydroxylating dioxygenase subunit beta [Burkholderia multivorans]
MDATTLIALDHLQSRYVGALDAQDMQAWLACFSSNAEASYICVSAENERRGLGLALMYDDSRARLQDRVSIVTNVWAGTYQPYRTRHIVQRIACRTASAGQVELSSNFMIAITPEGGVPALLTSGVYRDVVELQHDGQALLRERRAVYDADVLPRYVVFPF